MGLNNEYNLLVFNSTHHALAAERVLKEEGYKIMLVPVLAEITADCGMAIRINTNSNPLEILKNHKVEVAGYYRVTKKNLEKKIIRLNK
ncbi:hypothetical protein U472_07170 [Orenia metallireducens]|uniref:Putative Se/S carrier protein-like domain-containing protein n=1 Tax=Orenia metallireducens TaxID=1413210 RepID=A0A1C0AAC7_9FIRM|nr:DUF3343 domain-containing protein [Orenia metallireducens]OCL27242.1 hypothetical protein U472_07170 [Orenia metallireducens]